MAVEKSFEINREIKICGCLKMGKIKQYKMEIREVGLPKMDSFYMKFLYNLS